MDLRIISLFRGMAMKLVYTKMKTIVKRNNIIKTNQGLWSGQMSS